MKIVNHAAWKLASKHPQIDFDDLVQAGMFAALDAMPRFDPARSRLGTFLPLRVTGAMRDYLRDIDHAPRLVRQRSKQIAAAADAFYRRENREPNESELAAALSIGPDEWPAFRESATLYDKLSLEHAASTGDGKPMTFADELADARAPVPMRRTQSLDMLRLLTRGLTKRERLVVIGYYFEGDSMKEVGRQLDLSESRVSQMHSQIMERVGLSLRSRREELLQQAASN